MKMACKLTSIQKSEVLSRVSQKMREANDILVENDMSNVSCGENEDLYTKIQNIEGIIDNCDVEEE
jgi:hypothetical protein